MKLNKFLFYIPSVSTNNLLLDRIRLITLYAMFLVSLLGGAYNLSLLIKDRLWIPFLFLILFLVFQFISILIFWITRNIRWVQYITGASLVLIMTEVIVYAGGVYGMAVFFFIGGMTILFLIQDLRFGLFLPIYFAAGMTLRLLFVEVEPPSIFTDPAIVVRFLIIMYISVILGIVSCYCLHLLTKSLSRLAYTDPVTGISNRKKFMEMIYDLSIKYEKTEKPFALLGIKILDLNRINGSMGAREGDRLLQQTVSRIKNLLPEQSILCRWSGSLFILKVENTEVSYLKGIGAALIDVLTEPMLIRGNRISLPMLVCINRFPIDNPHHERILENLVTLVDRHRGHFGEVIFHSKDKIFQEKKRFKLMNALNHAYPDKDFTLYFQPKIRLSDEQCIGAEVLIRWNHEKFGQISPSEFIPIAEESGFIRNISRWVIVNTLEQLGKLESCIKDGEGFSISINLSVMDLKDQELIPFLQRKLESFAITNLYIEWEITERLMVDEDPQIKKNIEKLQSLGFKIAIDDFGTGYSSLSYLHKLKIDNLKIDQSFTRIIDSSGEGKQFPVVDAIISLGQSLGLEITAEGVENRVQRDYFIRKGCHAVQGWLYARPMPLEEFLGYMEVH